LSTTFLQHSGAAPPRNEAAEDDELVSRTRSLLRGIEYWEPRAIDSVARIRIRMTSSAPDVRSHCGVSGAMYDVAGSLRLWPKAEYGQLRPTTVKPLAFRLDGRRPLAHGLCTKKSPALPQDWLRWGGGLMRGGRVVDFVSVSGNSVA
jgi:hypothetical protein